MNEHEDPRAPYRVGDVIHLGPDDPSFDRFEDALEHAREMGDEGDAVVAVWDCDSDILLLVWRGVEYLP